MFITLIEKISYLNYLLNKNCMKKSKSMKLFMLFEKTRMKIIIPNLFYYII